MSGYSVEFVSKKIWELLFEDESRQLDWDGLCLDT